MAAQASFLNLPVELRQEIFVHVFSWPKPDYGEVKDYYDKAIRKGLSCGVCTLRFRHNRTSGDESGHPALVYGPPLSTDASISILRTSRQMYFEAADVLYNNTLFLLTNNTGARPLYGCHARARTFRLHANMGSGQLLGTLTELPFLHRLKHVTLDFHLIPAPRGIAVESKLQLFRSLLNSIQHARLSHVALRFIVNDLLINDPAFWQELARHKFFFASEKVGPDILVYDKTYRWNQAEGVASEEELSRRIANMLGVALPSASA